MDVALGKASDFEVGKGYQFSLTDNLHVLVVKLGDTFHAVDNVCPHRGAFLGQGRISGTVVTCPWHEWSFDLVSGEGVTNPISCLRRFPVEVRDGQVVVDVPE